MKNFINYIKSLYTAPSPEAMALRELEQAKRQLLEALSGREYADSMSTYHEARIKRLTAYLHSVTEEQK